VTQTGVILGTAAYMSPEQARGKLVDERTDIWAFGCLLFEMLTGQPAFGGEDVMLTLARVLDRATDLSSIPKTISPAVRHTIRLCLEKDPRERIADIRDVRLALAGAFESLSGGAPAATEAPTRPSAARLAIALAAGMLVTGAIAAALWPKPEPKPVTRFVVEIPAEQTLREPRSSSLSLSGDGRRLLYDAADGFHVRDLDSLEVVRVPGTAGELQAPRFSPDGEDIDFAHTFPDRPLAIERISVQGGPVTSLFTFRDLRMVTSATRTPSGTWLVSHRGGVTEIDPRTGAATLVIDVGEDQFTSGASLLPDGETVLFAMRANVRTTADFRDSRIVAAKRSSAPLGDAELTTVVPEGFDPRYLASTGHLLFVRDEVVTAVAFDPDALATRGEARAVLPGVRLAAVQADYAVAANGTLAYSPTSGDSSGLRWSWLGTDGRLEPVPWLPRLSLAGRQVRFPRLSPDGSKLVVAETVGDNDLDLWVYDLLRPGSRTLLAGDDTTEPKAVWMPDGESLIFYRRPVGLFRRAADASSREELLLAQPDGFQQLIPDWVSPDGSELMVTALTESGSGLYRVPLRSEAKLEPVLDDPQYAEGASDLSPDGRYLAYTTNESGTDEVHVRPYPDVTSRRVVVSTGGGSDPEWDARGQFLYYAEGVGNRATLVRVPVETSPTLVLGEPERLTGDIQVAAVRPNYDHDAANDRWLVVSTAASSAQAGGRSIVVVLNWTEWLRREVPGD